MTITAITKALTGERVVALSPETADEAATDWLRRPNLFPGRALTVATLQERQTWQAGHIAQRGQAFTPGVARGLQVGYAIEGMDSAGNAIVKLTITDGQGLAVSGEDVVLVRHTECLLSDLPVVAPPSLFVGVLDGDAQQAAEDSAAQNADPTPGAPLPRAVGPSLGELITAAPDSLPSVGILVLQPITVDTADFDPNDPCDKCPCDDGTSGTDPSNFEDWRIADGVRLLWYAWPQEWLALPADPLRLRNELATLIFNTESTLQHGDALPWEDWGVPVALIGVDATWQPLFADRASVVRQGGSARDPRLQLVASGSAVLAANNRLPALWQARIEQFAEQVAAAGEPAPAAADLAQAFSWLPPCGLLPTNTMDLQNLRSEFFPLGFDVDAAPVPVDQLDLALRASAGLAPFNLSNAESVRMLVPVPQAVWDPRLLIHETVAPEFQQTLDQFLLVRARTLGARQGLLNKQAVLTHAISGTTPVVPDFSDDPDALEIESLSPWGPPPIGGGHRSSFNTGLHQHYFQGATETLTPAANERLYCWVYLDPDNPPSTLMFQWLSGTWEHRAYWGDNLIAMGQDGTAARMRMGDMPQVGEWVRLEVPATSVGLVNATITGMSFALFGGRAAYGLTGASNGSVDRIWFCNILPQGAQKAGDEAWDFITNNDLYMPFEDPYSVLPITIDSVPPGGAHVEGIASGIHQHFFDSAAPFAVAATEHLYCWVYLDPNNPPREIMLQWHTADWEHRAFWGADLIQWGTTGTTSRLRVDDLPEPGGWVRLELPATSVGLGPASLNGMAFTLFDGSAAFGSAGAIGTAVGSMERSWLAGGLPSGANPTGIWNFLAPRDLYAPTPASRIGQVEALTALIDDPTLASLSGQERSQLPVLGLQGFIDYLTARANRADDIVDHGFVKVQTDVYRIRQLMQGNTAATRLAVSPALATIAQTDSAVASSAQIDTFLANLKAPAATFNALAESATPAAAAKAAAPKAAKVQSNIGIVKSGVSNISTITLSGQNNFIAPTLNLNLANTNQFSTNQLVATKTAITPIVSKLGTSYEVTNASPVIGNTFVRTTAIAQRLEDPAAKEAADYATASRYDAVTLLLQLADDLRLADSGVTPGLFEGVVLNGLQGDTFLGTDPTVRTRPFADFINPTLRATILPALLVAPVRATDPDESSYFSDSSDLSDHVVALMRQMEGRIKLYRDAISACQSLLTSVQTDANAIQSRIAAVADNLAEARHDVSVAQALLAEETDRINGINDQRATVLAEQVRFLAFVRPREVDNLLTAPRRDLDPALVAAPVPTCLMDHSDIPDDLQDMLQVIREAPSNWFVDIPKLIDQLDKPDLLIKTLQSAQIRTQMKAMLPIAAVPVTQDPIATAIARVTARQSDLLAPRVSAVQSLNISSLATATWQGVRSTAVQLVSLGDLIDGAHGRGQVATDAADAFNQMSRIAACLHAEFSGVLPAIRLDWATTLSEFDAAPNLRNLGSLARWSEIDYVDRRQMQSYVDWLFAQIDPNQASAESLINDVVRMCLLLASHAPVDRIIAGRMKQPVTGVQTGVRLPLTVIDPTRLRVGMQALMYRGGSVVARALVEDIGNAEVSARVIQTSAAKVDLGDDVRVQYSDAAAVSLTPVRTAMTKSLFI